MDEVKAKLERMYEMFQTQAWAEFKEAMNQTREALSDIRTVDSEKKLYINQGKLMFLDEMESYPSIVRQYLDEMENPLESTDAV